MSKSSSHLGLGALEKWDIATTSKFLKLYRNHKCLWDHTDPNYKDKNQRNNALDEISNGMALPGFDTRYVVLKIRALRSTYIYERRKVRQRLKNGEKFQTHLGWYHLADSFLRNYVVEKTYSGNTEDPNKDLPPPRIITEDLTTKNESMPMTGTIYKEEINTSNTTEPIEFFTTTTTDAKSELEFTLEEEQDDDDDDVEDDEDYTPQPEQKIPQIVQNFMPTLKRPNTNNNNNNKNMKKIATAPVAHEQQQPQQHNFTNSLDNKTQYVTIESSTSGTSTNISNNNNNNINNNNNTNYLRDDDNEDEFETFAKSVAMQFKKIPREDAYALQVQFQYLLSQAKLKAMGKSTSIILTDSQNFLSFK